MPNARLVSVSRSSCACAAATSRGWRWPKFSAEYADEAVEVAAAVVVDDPRALAVDERDRQRRVVRSDVCRVIALLRRSQFERAALHAAAGLAQLGEIERDGREPARRRAARARSSAPAGMNTLWPSLVALQPNAIASCSVDDASRRGSAGASSARLRVGERAGEVRDLVARRARTARCRGGRSAGRRARASRPRGRRRAATSRCASTSVRKPVPREDHVAGERRSRPRLRGRARRAAPSNPWARNHRSYEALLAAALRVAEAREQRDAVETSALLAANTMSGRPRLGRDRLDRRGRPARTRRAGPPTGATARPASAGSSGCIQGLIE